jgi:hypothetical protein
MSRDVALTGRVGPVLEAIGGEGPIRLGRQREVVSGDAHGRYHEAAVNGALFWASTGVAGVAPGTAFSATPPMALWNPPSSGRVLSIVQLVLAYVSGTLGAGFMAHGRTLGQTTVPTGGTEITPEAAALSGLRSKARAFQGSTLVAAPTIVRPAFSMGPALATTAAFPFLGFDDVNGAILVPHGVAWAFQGAALGAGTAPLVAIGVGFEEIEIPT